jgi:RND superfamily putative drug exporter
MPHHRNLAARAGRWSAGHRKTAILGWLAFVIAAVVLGGAAGVTHQREEDLGSGESGRADQIIAAGFPDHASEQVLVQSRGTLTFDDPRFKRALDDLEARLVRVPYVANLSSPLAHSANLVSADRRSSLVQFDVLGDSTTARERVGPALAAVAQAQTAHPELRIEELGDASAGEAIMQAFEDDAQRAEFLSLPITLVILVAAFGSLVAAGLPLLLGLTAVVATIGLLGPVSHVIPVADAITSVVLLVGLAVGVDYSMFYIRRERDERAAGRGNAAALEAAAATSGRAVLISGLTVIVAMSGMFVIGHPVFQSFAVGTIMVVAVAVAGSLTVLPATLAALGDRIDRGRLPLPRRRDRDPQSGVWAWIVGRVLGRPWVAVCTAGTLLIVLALPTLRLHTADAGVQGLPADLPIMQTYARIERAFPGGPLPAVVAVRIPEGKALSVILALPDVRHRALATGLLREPFGFTLSRDRRVGVITMAVAGMGTDATSNRALAALREQVLPATLEGLPGVQASVTGSTAMSRDFNALMKARAPWVFAFVLALAFLLLLVTFRSVVIPATAIVLNLLSVGAAYGVLVWIFQDGHLESLLGFNSIGGITSWLPLFLFVILFGLSMDYHVFILSRVREGHDRGMTTEAAVAHGIRTTAAVVTSAAIVMVAVFGIFATLSMIEFKQMGVGLALAVLIDATVIRAVLLPATMKLLGDRNWYLPRWLEWLPSVDVEAGSPPVAASRRVRRPHRHWVAR